MDSSSYKPILLDGILYRAFVQYDEVEIMVDIADDLSHIFLLCNEAKPIPFQDTYEKRSSVYILHVDAAKVMGANKLLKFYIKRIGQ